VHPLQVTDVPSGTDPVPTDTSRSQDSASAVQHSRYAFRVAIEGELERRVVVHRESAVGEGKVVRNDGDSEASSNVSSPRST
jgi:hypothetical protein